MRNKLLLLIVFAFVTLTSTTNAALIYSLDVDGCSGSCGTGPFGTVMLTQTGSTTVTVNVNLITGEVFAGTSAGDALEFNVAGPITISAITSGFAVGPAPDSASTFGTFLQSVTCTACQGGQKTNPAGPLSFTVTKLSGLSISDFFANSGGYYFASDIAGVNGNTGNVAATALQIPPQSIPEPASMALIGVGLLGFGVSRRLR